VGLHHRWERILLALDTWVRETSDMGLHHRWERVLMVFDPWSDTLELESNDSWHRDWVEGGMSVLDVLEAGWLVELRMWLVVDKLE
jgi:hypothetical protein